MIEREHSSVHKFILISISGKISYSDFDVDFSFVL